MNRSLTPIPAVVPASLIAAGLLLCSGRAWAGIEVDMYISPAPDAAASPSYDDWFLHAQQFALGAAAPVGSGFAQFLGDMSGAVRPIWEFETTDFPAWEGETDPYLALDERGQRMQAVYHIHGTAGEKVELRWIRALHSVLTWNGVLAPDPCGDLQPETGPADLDDTASFDPRTVVGYDDADPGTPISSGNDPVDHIIGTFGNGFLPRGRRPSASPEGCANPDVLQAQIDYVTGAAGISDLGSGAAGLTGSLAYDDGVNPLVSASGSVTSAGTHMALQVDDSVGPAEPVRLHLEVVDTMAQVASLGARITYDPGALSSAPADIVIEKGAGIPAAWDFVYLDASTPGALDLVLADPLTETLIEPAELPAALEAVRVSFRRLTPGCDALAFGFEAARPEAGSPAEGAFPESNQFIQFVDPATDAVFTDAAIPAFLSPGSGPAALHNHAFIRGNVNARGSHGIDIADAIDIAGLLFGGYQPPFDCPAAFDANNDGSVNITDLVTVVQAFFHPGLVSIPPPNGDMPGPGVPGAGTPDGGEVPSALGCPEGEPYCP